ncbi:matrixin family metalloprotease [Sandaracinus amylolyticus]|uniref:matrixin family metalloprotease n=1 Tax=Sandaracinus amylolyticus TaxID=927083 RepID=UPI001F02AC64|nr:matrixin family metalloprotease [Sandaracinus amylolyticus]UJR79226.1 Hypothetical protein I5071_12590 [Sandaracinus amylolyticus]
MSRLRVLAAMLLMACDPGPAPASIGLTCAMLDEAPTLVDLDLRFATADDARDYLEHGSGETPREHLIVATDGPSIATLPLEVRDDLTYCVSDELGASRDAVIAATERAAAMWASVADVRFRFVTPARCAERGVDAHLVIIPECGASRVVANAMLPWRSGREGQELAINTCYWDHDAIIASEDALARTLLHELGHVLGLVHAWNTADYVGPCECASSTSFLALAPYDPASIMNYPDCGATWSLFDPPALSDADRAGAEELYCAPGAGPPPCD